jgi:uncharacterized protein (TIGR03084 family)
VIVFDDLQAEEERLEDILAALDDDDWLRPSAAPGWSVADVVLHLAISEEVVGASARSEATSLRDGSATTMDELMERMVQEQRDSPASAFERWRAARRAALDILRHADPGARIAWATNPLPATTLATTRLAEHWAHGLDITEALDIPFEDTPRLWHIAWLGHRTLPYAFALAGLPPSEVRCELTATDGERWDFGPPDAPSRVSGPIGDFCRVGARRLSPDRSRLAASGPDGANALRLLRNYAS